MILARLSLVAFALLLCISDRGALAQFAIDGATTAKGALCVDAAGGVCTVLALQDTSIAGRSCYIPNFYTSTDGARTWLHAADFLFRPSSRFLSPYAIDQIDSLHACSVGWDQIRQDSIAGRLISTSDGGRTWIEEKVDLSAKLLDVCLLPNGPGMILGQRPSYIALKSESGWQAVDFAPQRGNPNVWLRGHTYGEGKYRVYCTDGKTLLWIYSTIDGWRTADSVKVPLDDSSQTGYPYIDCLLGDGDGILGISYLPTQTDTVSVLSRSVDGGKTWSMQSFGSGSSLCPSSFISARCSDTILMTDARHPNWIDYSSDAGLTWHFDSVVLVGSINGAPQVSAAARLSDGSFAVVYWLNVPPYYFIGRMRMPALASVLSSASSDALTVLSPNPTTDRIFLTGFDTEVKVVDVLGRDNLVGITDGTMNTSSLAPGVYFVLDARSHCGRFVKQ